MFYDQSILAQKFFQMLVGVSGRENRQAFDHKRISEALMLNQA